MGERVRVGRRGVVVGRVLGVGVGILVEGDERLGVSFDGSCFRGSSFAFGKNKAALSMPALCDEIKGGRRTSRTRGICVYEDVHYTYGHSRPPPTASKPGSVGVRFRPITLPLMFSPVSTLADLPVLF